jgi:hypothetical protein
VLTVFQRGLLSSIDPVVYIGPAQPEIRANLEARQFLAFEQPINHRSIHSQVLGHLICSHHFANWIHDQRTSARRFANGRRMDAICQLSICLSRLIFSQPVGLETFFQREMCHCYPLSAGTIPSERFVNRVILLSLASGQSCERRVSQMIRGGSFPIVNNR